jgi:hypothetical protein
MATAEKTAQVAQTKEAEFNLLDQAIASTKQTEPERAKELLKTLTQEASKDGHLQQNLTVTFNKAIAMIDEEDVEAAQRDHARSKVPEARGIVARPAPSDHEFGDQLESQDQAHEHLEA